MQRIAALTLNEHDRLLYSAYLKSLYREFGMWETYAFLPAIMLPEFNFDSKIDIKDGKFSFSGEIIEIDGMQALMANESIEDIKPALFLTKGKLPKDFKIEPFSVKAKALVLIEYDEYSFRVVRQRSLRMDK